MKKNLSTLFVISIFFVSSLLFSTPESYAEKGEDIGIVAEGLGVISGKDISRARETAVSDALGLALSQYLGEKVKEPKAKGGVFEKGYAITEPRIYSKAKEAIDSYEILDEASFENVYWVKLKAYFKEDTIKQRELDMIRVLVEAEQLAIDGDLPVSSELCKTGITELLAGAGLKVVEQRELLQKFWNSQVIEDFTEQQIPDVDIIVLVKAQSQELEKFGDFYSFKTNANVRIIKPYSTEVIATTRVSAMGERSLDRVEALENSLLATGRKTGEYVIDKVVQNASPFVSYRVKIKGVKKRIWADKAVESLLKKEGIKKVSSRFISPELTILEVEIDAKAQEKLPYYLEHLKKVNLKVLKESYKWIEAEAR